MATQSCTGIGPYTINDSSDLAEIVTALEALTYSATAKWVVVSSGSMVSIIQVDTA